ncbi:hypothetical protein [Jiulongibacter sediminis]|uniref:Uncharacterized protein n=1 Tax=Jiulongibacter sediminis TaxID=1605367 RepID=A0A0P7C026_9BACT|nr:hypothetical protein [Jiulongibacter sediminis]KPM46681.1 hypothetical protein AFM12_18015 [Jiulongibacter sediminis]TBX21586.1 hypothetical protein TK44_18020 [Jiulongibacter sediminis]
MSDTLKIRLAAFTLMVVGGALILLYLSGHKPAFLQIPVFALASTYNENRFVQMVQTNAIDEIGFLLLTAGLALLVFNTFREEAREKRLAAFEFALKYSLILAVIAYVLVFGYAIFGVLMALFPVFVVLYLIKFELLKKARN